MPKASNHDAWRAQNSQIYEWKIKVEYCTIYIHKCWLWQRLQLQGNSCWSQSRTKKARTKSTRTGRTYRRTDCESTDKYLCSLKQMTSSQWFVYYFVCEIPKLEEEIRWSGIDGSRENKDVRWVELSTTLTSADKKKDSLPKTRRKKRSRVRKCSFTSS